MILAGLLENRGLLQRIRKVMVCDLWYVDFDPFCVFVFQGSLLVILIMIDSREKRPIVKAVFENFKVREFLKSAVI